MTDINSYYMHQAGNGLAGFRGVRYQRGNGFFGRLLSGAVYPLLRFLGQNILKTGKNFAQDIFESQDFSKTNLKNVAKQNIKKTAADILETAAGRMRGSGMKRKIKKTRKNSIKTKVKTKKRIQIKGSGVKRRKKQKRSHKKTLFGRKNLRRKRISKNKSNLLF